MQKRGVSRLFVQIFFVSLCRKSSVGNTLVHQKISGSEKFYASERGGIKFLRRKLFPTQYQKNFVREHLGVSETFVQRKILCIRRRYHQTPLKNLCPHSADKIRRRTLLCFERILVSKSFKQRRGEASRLCQNFFYLRGPKKLHQGTILCSRKFLVGKNVLWIKAGGISRFSVENFVPLYPNLSLEDTLVFQKNSFIESSHASEGGGASRFRRNFLSHRSITKSFVKEPFCFPEIFWY